MANHKSAKKRSRQNVKRSAINSTAMSKFKTSLNKLEASIKDKDTDTKLL